MNPREPKDTPGLSRAVTRRPVIRRRSNEASATTSDDAVAVEEPLELRVASDPLATLMRTPGEDHYLVAGFLYSEGVIGDLADLGRIAHCGRPTDPGYGNVIDVSPGPGVALAPEHAARPGRSSYVNSACGVCGRQTIADLLDRAQPLRGGPALPSSLIAASLRALEQRQAAFGRTGAMHAALVCDPTGRALACSEDVGRHNAVDKVIGKLLYSGALSRSAQCGGLLTVSSRSGFEIIQKAALAQLPVVISVGAPTSLAIDLAEASAVTLIGFAREDGFNIYTHARRIID